MNGYEARARTVKAYAIADALQTADVSAAQAATMHPANWPALAKAAGQRPPSPATWQLVVDILRDRESVDAADRAAQVGRAMALAAGPEVVL